VTASFPEQVVTIAVFQAFIREVEGEKLSGLPAVMIEAFHGLFQSQPCPKLSFQNLLSPVRNNPRILFT
jgi:hypothetical protein